MKKSLKKFSVFLFSLVLLVTISACTTPPATTSDSPATDSTGSGGDSCLQGIWTMDTVSLDLFIASVVPVTGLNVPAGLLGMEFSGDRYTYSGAYTVRFSLGGDSYLESDANHLNSGTFSTADGFLTFVSEGTESEALVWTAYKNGQTYTYPGTGPNYSLPAPDGGPYRCTASSLEIDTRGATGDTVTMFFTK